MAYKAFSKNGYIMYVDRLFVALKSVRVIVLFNPWYLKLSKAFSF